MLQGEKGVRGMRPPNLASTAGRGRRRVGTAPPWCPPGSLRCPRSQQRGERGAFCTHMPATSSTEKRKKKIWTEGKSSS